jgi:hypothetical protein
MFEMDIRNPPLKAVRPMRNDRNRPSADQAQHLLCLSSH